ncbi:MAG: CRISPR-associated endonuclease Cas2 [Ktedonobacteraceae bacterium]|nr:CRISPR-associated endonuclease Cas2 [Ktedonobacteraceae bacterium]
MKKIARTNSDLTCYVIAYDIPSDKRRTKIHKVLLGFGTWTQYSLFECFLSRKDLILLQTKLAKHLIVREDSVRFYPLCANCVSRVETVGGPLPSDDALFLL